ncbi:PREDICTED: apoptosis-enhancing nuclease-like [Nanorana parkeri]|uniref:apoptosis-enhancing nuclease-like n=1 Tax=Nanorana parkeri TaxID=125878 RepID=UPI000854D29F|nr:PREDICTED: apoptosis-enhancing nuclease-like [Nanorana parkeri]
MEGRAASNLFYGFRGSSQYLSSSHKDIVMEKPKVSCVKSHRKSRKHQRFVKYKEFLQQHGTRKLKTISRKGDGSCCATNQDSHCKLHVDELSTDCLDDQSKLDKIKAMLCSLPTMATSSSVCSTACDYDSGLSMSSSSHSSRPSSPCSWLKPGKCVAIDCEMVGTGPGGRISELARCSIVDYRGDVVYDKYIKPQLPITDYRTRWSGITIRHMKNAIPFKVAQKEILNILKDKRVIGHAVQNDFKALRYYHPKEQTRDTSRIHLLIQMAELSHTPSLKSLAWCLLQKRIQVGKKGHSSVEDAQTCMELYKLVEDQLEQDLLNDIQEATVSIPEEDRTVKNNHYMDDQYWPSDLDEDCK